MNYYSFRETEKRNSREVQYTSTFGLYEHVTCYIWHWHSEWKYLAKLKIKVRVESLEDDSLDSRLTVLPPSEISRWSNHTRSQYSSVPCMSPSWSAWLSLSSFSSLPAIPSSSFISFRRSKLSDVFPGILKKSKEALTQSSSKVMKKILMVMMIRMIWMMMMRMMMMIKMMRMMRMILAKTWNIMCAGQESHPDNIVEPHTPGDSTCL